MKDSDSSKKTDVLIAALNERYSSTKAIRERVQNIGIWALGLLATAGAWVLQSGVVLSPERKFMYLIGIGIAVIVLRHVYLQDLHVGFKGQQKAAVRIETALGLYDVGIFDDEKESVYPEKWKKAGTDGGDGSFFSSTYVLLYLGAAFLAVAIVLSPCADHRRQDGYRRVGSPTIFSANGPSR